MRYMKVRFFFFLFFFFFFFFLKEKSSSITNSQEMHTSKYFNDLKSY